MAITLAQQSRVRSTSAPAPVPLGVAALSLAAPGLDLFHHLIGASVLGDLAIAALVGTIVALVAVLPRRLNAPWLFGALVAFGTSLVFRFAPSDVAPLFAAAGVAALGAGGAFASRLRSERLELLGDDESPAAVPVVQTASPPTA